MMHMQGLGQKAGLAETQFFNEQGILVTSARIVVNSTTFPLAHLTSVTPFTIPAKRGGAIFLALFGFLSALGAIYVKTYGVLVFSLPFLAGGVDLPGFFGPAET